MTPNEDVEKPVLRGFSAPSKKTHRSIQVAPKDVALAAWRALYKEIVALRIDDVGTHMIVAQIEF